MGMQRCVKLCTQQNLRWELLISNFTKKMDKIKKILVEIFLNFVLRNEILLLSLTPRL